MADSAPLTAREGHPWMLLAACNCSSGCSCGCQSSDSCQCGGNCD